MGIPYGAATVASGTPPDNDLANAVVEGVFTAPGQSEAYGFYGSFNVCLGGVGGSNTGWTGSVRLEWSFDGGTTWFIAGVGGGGQQAIYTSGFDVGFVASAGAEKGLLFRLNCTALSVGQLAYRMSQTSPAPTAWGVPPG